MAQYGSLDQLARAVSACKKCSLCRGRTRAVPGSGRRSRIMLVGEAPGRSEDLRGRPFVGPAGKKLDEALDYAGLSRSSVYITNVAKCRPPSNRVPTDAERQACAPYLEAESRLVRPAITCVMGATALESVLGEGSISGCRGRFFSRGRKEYYVTVHPAAAIYRKSLLQVLKSDMARLAQCAGLPRPLSPSFFARDTALVARSLLGKTLVRHEGKRISTAVITETEAYGHADDQASHAHGGRTRRNAAMFGRPGRAYVYFTYGMHYCFNAVAYGPGKEAGAVLIRAASPQRGAGLMESRRRAAQKRAGARQGSWPGGRGLADGPAKLAQAMAIGPRHYGADLAARSGLYIGHGSRPLGITASARVGISAAKSKRWNFKARIRAA